MFARKRVWVSQQSYPRELPRSQTGIFEGPCLCVKPAEFNSMYQIKPKLALWEGLFTFQHASCKMLDTFHSVQNFEWKSNGTDHFSSVWPNYLGQRWSALTGPTSQTEVSLSITKLLSLPWSPVFSLRVTQSYMWWLGSGLCNQNVEFQARTSLNGKCSVFLQLGIPLPQIKLYKKQIGKSTWKKQRSRLWNNRHQKG